MEKCGKVWRRELATAVPRGGQDGVYSISAAVGVSELRACSACAGDYEDPERTAWTPDDAEEEECDSVTSADTKEFPAEE